MKRGRKKIHYSNRFIYFLIMLGILAIVATGVFAYNSSPANPVTFGHSSNEINFSSGISNAGSIASTTQITSPKYCIGTNCITSWPNSSTGSSLTKGTTPLYEVSHGCQPNANILTLDDHCQTILCLSTGSAPNNQYYYNCLGNCTNNNLIPAHTPVFCANTLLGYLVN